TRCAPRSPVFPTTRSSCTRARSTASCTHRTATRTVPTTPPTRGAARCRSCWARTHHRVGTVSRRMDDKTTQRGERSRVRALLECFAVEELVTAAALRLDPAEPDEQREGLVDPLA